MNEDPWYYAVNGQQEGPIARADLIGMLRTGRLHPDTMVWTPGFADWQAASDVAALADGIVPPPLQNFIASEAAAAGYAGFWKRVAAALIDGLVLTAGISVIGGLMGFNYLQSFADEPDMQTNLIGTLVSWLYSALLESSAKQATLGKMALGIQVTDLAGQRISFGKATGRHFGQILSFLILGIGYLMVLFTERKQALHDILAGCLVVNKP